MEEVVERVGVVRVEVQGREEARALEAAVVAVRLLGM